jgi:hypothetical protein
MAIIGTGSMCNYYCQEVITMNKDENNNTENANLQPIPKEQQDISVKEIVEMNYDVVPSSVSEESVDDEPRWEETDPVVTSPSGQFPCEDSIEASSDDLGGTQEGHAFSAGYDSAMATRIGNEKSNNSNVERLRQLHEGRHQSDGQHSLRESQRDKKRIAQAICSALPLTSHEREEVVTVVQNLNLDRFGNQKGISRVTLGVVAVVVDEQYRTAGDDIGEIVAWTDEFRTFCENHDISMSDLSTIKQNIREALATPSASMSFAPKRRDLALPEPTSPTNLPDEYWERQPPKYWVAVARTWDRDPQELRGALPDEYRKRVDALHRWEPWTEYEERTDSVESPTQDNTTVDENNLIRPDDGNLDEHLEAEIMAKAEVLLNEMEAELDAGSDE